MAVQAGKLRGRLYSYAMLQLNLLTNLLGFPRTNSERRTEAGDINESHIREVQLRNPGRDMAR